MVSFSVIFGQNFKFAFQTRSKIKQNTPKKYKICIFFTIRVNPLVKICLNVNICIRRRFHLHSQQKTYCLGRYFINVVERKLIK